MQQSEASDMKEIIKKRFNLPNYTSINGETSAIINDDDMGDLKGYEEKGYIQIRIKS